MADGHADYSGTPLWKKLGIAPGSRVHVVSPPQDFDRLLTALAPLPPGVSFLRTRGSDLDVVVLFVTRANDLARRFPPLVGAIGSAGRLWIAWPKKASGVATDVDDGLVRRAGLEAGLVDNKTAAVSDVYQGLQFVRRLKDRPR
jgi:hypothetical protein